MRFSLLTLSTVLLSTPSFSEAWSSSSTANRRQVLSHFAGAFVSGSTAVGFLPNIANAGSLLEEYGGTESMKIDSSPKQSSSGPAKVAPKQESNMEPNLRANYYYPTNKKRYLPRIKKCNDMIPGAAEAIGTGNWEAAVEFAQKVADDTILPMRLYTSSLVGGGTNVKVAFAKDMNKATDDFEKAQKKLVKALAKQDQSNASTALEELATALQAYRTSGRLLGPDGGGDIPSVDEIRRSACRVQGRTFEKKVKERDARLKMEAGGAAVSST